MAIKANKPNLLAVLTRRRNTVENFLAQSGVNDNDTLIKTLLTLEAHYLVTEEFKKQALELFPIKKEKHTIATIKKVVNEITKEIIREPVVNNNKEDVGKKPKRRRKTATKKSVVKKQDDKQ